MSKTQISDWSKKLNKNVLVIQKAVASLQAMGLEIVIVKDVETMTGRLCDHVYVTNRVDDMHKHLLTVFQD